MDRKRIGRYEILGTIGCGALGCVLRASDPVNGRILAIKSIHPNLLANGLAAESRERFYREARAAEALSNPGIVALIDVGEDSGIPFWVMELVEGETLRAAIDRGESYSIDRLCEIGLQVADTLGYAHRFGVVHGAIRPSNILITSAKVYGVERPRITDFGMINPFPIETVLTEKHLETVGFISPEQLSGARIDGRADLFSLGATLYWMATGKQPFEGESFASISFNVLNTDPVAPSKRNRSIPPQLEAVIQRCLTKNPTDRYASAEELYINLSLLRMSSPVLSSREPAKQPKPATENDPGETTEPPSTGQSQRLRVFAGSAPSSVFTQPAPDEASLPGIAPGRQVDWMTAIMSMQPPLAEIPLGSIATEVREDRSISSEEPAAVAATETIVPQTTFDAEGIRRAHRRIRKPVSRPVARNVLPPLKQVATAPVQKSTPQQKFAPAQISDPGQVSAAQPRRNRGLIVILGLVLLSVAIVPASILVQRRVTGAAQRVPAPMTASVPSAASSLPAAARSQVLTGSAVPNPPTRPIETVKPASEKQMVPPSRPIQTEAMNQQLNAPKKIPQNGGSAVAELAPSSVALDTAGGEGMGGNIAMGNVFNARPQQVVNSVPSGPIKIAAGAASGMLVRKNPPVYPEFAKTARVTGKVEMEVTVSTLGTVKDLRVISGPALLTGAAADAVRTWRYKPYILYNQPHEFQTTVSIAFTLGG